MCPGVNLKTEVGMITDLEDVPGVGPGIAKKLRAANITTVELLAVQHHWELKTRAGISEEISIKIVKNAQQLSGMFDFKSGLKVEADVQAKPRLKTGIQDVDGRLMGGLEIGSLIEFYGRASAGKTQWCYHLAVRAQMPVKEGGLGCSVVWLDTEKAFNPCVVRANAVRWGLDPDTVLDNIQLMDVVNTVHLNALFEKIPQMCAEENVQLVVVDSLTGQFRQEYKGKDRLIPRQQDLNSLYNIMYRTAIATDATFLYTNQTISMSDMGQFTHHEPVGGNISAHAAGYRFQVSVAESGGIRLILKDYPSLPEFEETLSLGWGGFYKDPLALKQKEPAVVEYLETHGYSIDLDDSIGSS